MQAFHTAAQRWTVKERLQTAYHLASKDDNGKSCVKYECFSQYQSGLHIARPFSRSANPPIAHSQIPKFVGRS